MEEDIKTREEVLAPHMLSHETIEFEAMGEDATPVMDKESSSAHFGISADMVTAFRAGDTHFGIFDVRSQKQGESLFQREGGHVYIDPRVPYVVMQLDGDISTHASHHLKGVREGESVQIGREHHTDRFMVDEDFLMSRSHLDINLRDGVLAIEDHSTNGTEIFSSEEQLMRDLARSETVDNKEFGSSHEVTQLPDYLKLSDGLNEAQFWNQTSPEGRQLASHEQLKPRYEITIGDRKFLMSGIVQEQHGRDKAVLYTDMDGTIEPLLLYKSMSDGGWRVSMGIDEDGIYIKGKDIHYTQETKLADEIEEALEHHVAITQDSKGDIHPFLLRVVSSPEYVKDMESRFGSEVDVETIRGNASKLAEILSAGELKRMNLIGYYYDSRTDHQENDRIYLDEARKMLLDEVNQAIESTPGFMPDFSQGPVMTVTRKHSMLGPVTYRRYKGVASGREVYWDIGDDDKGRVWVDQIQYADSAISSFGTHSRVINSGMLTSKPIEYDSQATALGKEDVDVIEGTHYVDITKFLAKLTPIKAYNLARTTK